MNIQDQRIKGHLTGRGKPIEPSGRQKPVHFQNGRLYLTKAFERKLFFILTLMMLVWGLLVKTGLL